MPLSDRPLRLGYRQAAFLRKHPLLCPTLPEAGEFVPIPRFGGLPGGLDGIIGWADDRAARELALKHGLDFTAVDYGFLRALSARSGPTLSYIADRSGIYYDASAPSDLETLIAAGVTPEENRRALAGIALLKKHRLSSLNDAPDLPSSVLPPARRPRVLVIDQARNDITIRGAQADAASFGRMLAAARAETPEAEILLRLPAEGDETGHLLEAGKAAGCTLISVPCPSWDLLERVEKVYTVSSFIGFEALMAGLPVRCFGLPFYAGWGATDDEQACPRRLVRRTTTEIFAAAYFRYTRYANPYTAQAGSFDETVTTLALWRTVNEANRQPIAAVGMSIWKQQQVSRFLASTEGPPRFIRSARTAARWAAERKGRIVVWASRQPPTLEAEAAALAVPVVKMEDGFLRSVGLGADFIPAASLVLDARGLYFDPRQPSDLEHLLLTSDFPPDLTARAAALRENIVRHGITKYNTGSTATPVPWPTDGRRRLFVPGQVQDDRSVQTGSPDIRTNLDLLKRVRAEAPDAYIVYKPHPDVDAGHRIGGFPDSVALEHADHVARGVSSDRLIQEADEIHLMTSLVGFEALLRGKQVHCYGQPFYCGWGLTHDRLPVPRRTRQVSLDELVAATLLLYALYVDPVTGLPCGPEIVIRRFTEGFKPRITPLILARRGLGNLRRKLQGLRWSLPGGQR